MTSSLRPARVLGYASLSPNGSLSFLDCELLREFSVNVTAGMEILAEEYHPSERRRPCFNELRRIIAKGESKVLVVPSLFHIAAGERERLVKFLNFLEFYDVRLLSLSEGVDSHLLNQESILLAATQTCPPPKIEAGSTSRTGRR